jgi:hypothetical protein
LGDAVDLEIVGAQATPKRGLKGKVVWLGFYKQATRYAGCPECRDLGNDLRLGDAVDLEIVGAQTTPKRGLKGNVAWLGFYKQATRHAGCPGMPRFG